MPALEVAGIHSPLMRTTKVPGGIAGSIDALHTEADVCP
jgi:hypothetical protein